ncbi:MAG TPA: Rieske (2Fe-2S) protein [Acidobacteriota bacterium]|nr:Rieske (2Fe-2S) protein [Acidobacteriota bacterium]
MSHNEDKEKPDSIQRRKLIRRLGAGMVGASLGIPVIMSARALVPNALYEKPLRFKAGQPEQFTQGPTFIADQGVFVFREGQAFYCIGATCTHLGCTVQIVNVGRGRTQTIEFHCPCHGSKFRADGTNFDGPAPRPLSYFRLDFAPDDGQLVVDLSQQAEKGWRLSLT